MEEKQTEQDTRELLHGWASRAAAHANREAKASSGWKKWLYVAAAIVAGAVAFFTATGCTASYTQSAAGDITFTATVVEPAPHQK
jgi:hypothetical protein